MEWLLVPDGLVWLSISNTADLLWSSLTTISRVYREWSEKEKISSEWELCGRKCLVDVRGQRRMGRLVRDDRKATVTQITTPYNQGVQNTISEHTTRRTLKQMCYSSRRPHRVRSYKLRTGNGGYNSHRLTKIGHYNIGNMLPGLMSLDFCFDIQMVGSEFGVKNIKALIHPALSQWFRLVVVWGIFFLAHFGPLGANWALFKCHSLPEYCYWLCPSLYDYSVPIFWWLLTAG